MEKVYGRRKIQRQSKPLSGKILLFGFAFLIGYLTASFMDFSSLGKLISQHFVSAPPVKKQVQAERKRVKPKFEFYTLLAKDSSTLVPVHGNARVKETRSELLPDTAKDQQQPVKVLIPESRTAESNSQSSKKTDNYLVQVAAYNRREDAEHLRASLVLTGFDVRVSPVIKNNTTWYRVILGPFLSQKEAEKAKITVAASHNLSAMIKRG